MSGKPSLQRENATVSNLCRECNGLTRAVYPFDSGAESTTDIRQGNILCGDCGGVQMELLDRCTHLWDVYLEFRGRLLPMLQSLEKLSHSLRELDGVVVKRET